MVEICMWAGISNGRVLTKGLSMCGAGFWKGSIPVAYKESDRIPSLVYAEVGTKAIFPVLAAALVLNIAAHSETCREVVRDTSGRVTQNIDHQKSSGGTARSVIRDASGGTIGTSTSQTSSGGHNPTTYRDASGRVTGVASTNGSSSGSSQTTYRDASGRTAGSATFRTNGTSGGLTDFLRRLRPIRRQPGNERFLWFGDRDTP